MSDALSQALSNPGPHTAETLAAALPDFPVEAIRQALEVLAAQGVLERINNTDGNVEYRYVAPERYLQADLDVVRDVGRKIGNRPR